jgi:epoxide hydrolase
VGTSAASAASRTGDHTNIVRWSTFEGGGHYSAYKKPDVLVGDVREFFRDLR